MQNLKHNHTHPSASRWGCFALWGRKLCARILQPRTLHPPLHWDLVPSKYLFPLKIIIYQFHFPENLRPHIVLIRAWPPVWLRETLLFQTPLIYFAHVCLSWSKVVACRRQAWFVGGASCRFRNISDASWRFELPSISTGITGLMYRQFSGWVTEKCQSMTLLVFYQ